MPETIERSTCPACGRPIFRYVIVHLRRTPWEPQTTTTWWIHEDNQTFACEQRPADG